MMKSGALIRTKIFFACALFASGCGGNMGPTASTDASFSNCPSKTAAISVGDGFFQILCGCTGAQETPGTVVAQPSTLTCKLPTSDSVLFFYFLGNYASHQIVPNIANAFAPSPLITPDSLSRVRVHTISFPTTATTYSFSDIISGMQGQIIVP